MELLILAIVLNLAGAQESQMKGPQNTLSFVGSIVTLKCSTSSRHCSGIDWQKYVHGASPITVFKGPNTMLNTNVTDRDRYSVDNSSGCDLIIRNVQLKDAGRFICSTIISSSQETKTAHLIVLGAQESLVEGPQNTLSLVGSNVTLRCSSSYRNCSGIDWLKYIPGSMIVTIFKGPRTMLNNFDRDRYSVDNSSGCDLIIKNVQLTDAARFICSIKQKFKDAAYIHVFKSAHLIISATQPNCVLNVSLHDTVEGDGVHFNCAVTYSGTIFTNASMVWKGVTNASAAVKNGNTISRSYTVVASSPEVSSFTCETSFAIETDDYEVSIVGLATNIPSDNCSTSAIRVLYSVRNVTLSPSLSNYSSGTVITCAAKGHPSPTFTWQEKDPCGVWTDIQNCSTFSLTDVSSKRYRCVALNVVRGRSYTAISPEIQFSGTDNLSTWTISASGDHLGFHTIIGICIGIGVGIGFIFAILLASIAFAMLVKHKYLELHSNPAVDGAAQHQDHEMSPSSRKHSAVDRSIPGTGIPLVGEQESTYAGLGEDRDANEYASLEQKQKAKPSKKSRP